ncbi:MAG: hypothetical protein JW818_22900 [Pirellulales bacterium]|nr:hypothetical protein [Pirellulales bacterium]
MEGLAKRLHIAVGLMVLIGPGCAPRYYAPPGVAGAPPTVCGPVLIPPGQPECVWETVVDVVDDYFQVRSEEPIRLVEGIATDGELVTFPDTGATIFEPWRHDSANMDQRLESTVQSIRRWALVRVTPAEQGRAGYWVDVSVYKELEDLPRPVRADAGDATFRYDGSLTRVVNPVTESGTAQGWIPMGRDAALESRILGQLLSRTGTVPVATR